MKRKSLLFGTTLVLLAALSGLRAFAPQAEAQATLDDRVTLHVRDADVREALRTIFKQAKRSYTIVPEVAGRVSEDFGELSLSDALALTLRQVDAGWREEDGVVQVVPLASLYSGYEIQRPDPTNNVLLARTVPQAPPVATLDQDSLYVACRGALYKLDKTNLTIVGRNPPSPPRRIRIGSEPGFIGRLVVPPVENDATTALAWDERFVYLVSGTTVSKVEKSTMGTVAKVELR